MEKLFNEKKCSECGRVFIVADAGAYRYKKNVGNRLSDDKPEPDPECAV